MKKTWNWEYFCESVLIKLAGLGIVALLVAQAFLFYEPTRIRLSRIDRLEGDRITLQMPSYAGSYFTIAEKPAGNLSPLTRDGKTMHISMRESKTSNSVAVKINGELAGNFGQGVVSIVVRDGDYIVIDASEYQQEASYLIKFPEGGVAFPADGQIFTGKNAIIPVGKIVLTR